MSEQTHCDLCGVVIAPTVQHLALWITYRTGPDVLRKPTVTDICPACTAGHPILARWFQERVDGTQPATPARPKGD